MKIDEIYIYPIKSIRGVSVSSATLTAQGIPFDRRFMLLRDYKEDGKSTQGTRYDNMHVSKFPSMCLFTTSLTLPTEDDPNGGEVEVTYSNPDDGSKDTLKVPLQPQADDLELLDVNMHSSPTKGYDMGSKFNDWFSAHFGFDVALVYLGANRRTVLGNLAPNAATKNPKRQQQQSANNAKSWLSSITQTVLGSTSNENGDDDEDYQVGFADCSPYLIVSSTSVDDVSTKLPDGEEMDLTKFRPNIVVSGAAEPFEEDFWRELTISSTGSGTDSQTKLILTSNCLRCASLNVDYSTGKATNQMLKKLSAYRRIDTGHKYSPAFGRYGFLTRDTEVVAGVLGANVRVGDEVEVTARNEERTVFKWPGLGQTKKEDIWAY